eukprot:416870_1
MTLYWNNSTYQCDVYPTQLNAIYLCNSSNTKTVTSQCLSSTIQYGLQISNDDDDSVSIEQIIIKNIHNISTQSTAIIDYFCVNATQDQYTSSSKNTYCLNAFNGGYDVFRIDMDDTHAPYQLFELDQNILFNYQQNFGLESYVKPIPGPFKAFSPFYGQIDFTKTELNGYYYDYDQGRLNGISNWGYMSDNYEGLFIKSWSADHQTSNHEFGQPDITYTTPCDPFSLPDNDYITGYKIYFDDTFVFGLELYTLKGSNYSCVRPDTATSKRSDYISYECNTGGSSFYYLSGWQVNSGWWIDQIKLQFTKYQTNSPTTQPTQPTFQPTHQPTNQPSISPTNQQSISPSSLSISKNTEFDTNFTIILISGGCILLLCICVSILFLCVFKNKEKSSDKQPLEYIKNGLGVIIAIGDYENDDEIVANPDITDSYLRDLPVFRDVDNLKHFFKQLNYKIIPQTAHEKYDWTESEVINFLENDVVNELHNDEGELKYDGLIICVSCHGIESKIVTSDYRTIEKAVIHRIISIKAPKSRLIPRIFIFDACDGSAKREYIRASTVEIEQYNDCDTNELHNGIGNRSIAKGVALNDISGESDWAYGNVNPDYKLVQLHASNIGYQARICSEKGSYLTFEFTQKILENLNEVSNKTLSTICLEIQNELHDAGKQQTTNTFNNGTQHLQIVKNTKDDINDNKEQHKDDNDQQKGIKLDTEFAIVGLDRYKSYAL